MSLGLVAASWYLFTTDLSAQVRWQLSAEPTLVIGTADGPAMETFHDIRGVATATEGVIVVADGGASELRVYSPEGRFVRAFGGFGDGAREFRRIAWIDMCGGPDIVAYDLQRYRIQVEYGRRVLDEFLVEGPGEMPRYSLSCGPPGRSRLAERVRDPDGARSLPP